MAPNMLPWSVSAMAGMPASLATAMTSSRRFAPSSRLYWLWRWRWTKSDMRASVSGQDDAMRMLPEGAPSRRALLGLHLQPAGADDVVEAGVHGEERDAVDERARQWLERRPKGRDEHE